LPVSFLGPSDIAHSIPYNAQYRSMSETNRLIRWLCRYFPDYVYTIPRGYSPEGRQIFELVVRDPDPGNDSVEIFASNADPHACDERTVKDTLLHICLQLVARRHKELHGREYHVLFSTPDDGALVELLAKFVRKGMRNVAVRVPLIECQSGWTREPPGMRFTNASSPGWHAVNAMMYDITRRVCASKGRLRWRLFNSGHNAIAAPGTKIHADGKRGREVGLEVEAVADSMGEPLSDVRGEANHLEKYEDSQATFRADTAQAFRDAGYPIEAGCSDVENALWYSEEFLDGELTIVVVEAPEAIIRPRKQFQTASTAVLEDAILDLERERKAALDLLAEIGYEANRIHADQTTFARQLKLLDYYAQPSAWGSNEKVDGDHLGTPLERLIIQSMWTVWDVRHLTTARVTTAPLARLSSYGAGGIPWGMYQVQMQEKVDELINLAERYCEFDGRSPDDQFVFCGTWLEAAYATSMDQEYDLNFRQPEVPDHGWAVEPYSLVRPMGLDLGLDR
jgi:hypothetical protein